MSRRRGVVFRSGGEVQLGLVAGFGLALSLYLYLNLYLDPGLSLAAKPRRMSRSFPNWGDCPWFSPHLDARGLEIE